MPRPPPLRFMEKAVEQAAEAWNFNCGPAAVCAVLGMTPEELRPHLGDFEQKGYTNPTLMFDILRRLRVRWELRASATREVAWPSFGLARIQWGGPWTKPGVPIPARYRKTHWVATCQGPTSRGIFDVNAMASGGWISLEDWETVFIPWILKQGVPRADGTWWLTHAIEIHLPAEALRDGVSGDR